MSEPQKQEEEIETGKAPATSDGVPGSGGSEQEDASSQPGVSVGAWKDRRPPVRRAFPGPGGASVPLRVAFERDAYAELVAHAKESLDKEVCGVLVGDVCEDDEGHFVHVKAVIRGASAREGGGHVTYTQETWNKIHLELEEKHPKLGIVGWYHSHPGFGVEFSEMDSFIQRNFFPMPAQVAFVTDPLGGDEAICVNGPDGIRHVDRFWIDGRERRCHVPERSSFEEATERDSGAPTASEALGRIEAKLGQLIQALDEQQTGFYRFLMTIGLLVAFAVVMWIGFSIYNGYVGRHKPPKMRQYVRIPVQVGDEVVYLGVEVVDWEIPPELNVVERLRTEVGEKLRTQYLLELQEIEKAYRREIERLEGEAVAEVPTEEGAGGELTGMSSRSWIALVALGLLAAAGVAMAVVLLRRQVTTLHRHS